MQYGQVRTSQEKDDGTAISVVEVIRDGLVVKSLRQFHIRVKVGDTQAETAEFLRFSDDLRLKREAGTLVIDREDASTIPAFLIDYPKKDIDGSYFVVKRWTELL